MEHRKIIRAAAVQMPSGPDRLRNLERADSLVHQAASQGAVLVVLPENFSLMSDRNQPLPPSTSPELAVDWAKATAKKLKIWLQPGSISFPASKKSKLNTNTSLLINPSGKIVARYDKIHLFDVHVSSDQTYEESKSIFPGKKSVVAKTPFAQLGLSICYDIRFPELYRKLSQKKANVLLIPAAFTQKTGEAHWDLLTRARAVENLSFVIAPGICGSPYPGRHCYGFSRIIDPWGKILAEVASQTETGLAVADLDFEALQKVRKNFPALDHRRKAIL